MHLQVKVVIGVSAFPDDDSINTSREYRRGILVDILSALEPEFNIRGASGHRIEFDGEFTFWVERKDGDDDTDKATEDAAELLRGNGHDARVVEVSVQHLSDTPGALLAFIQTLTDQGYWIEEITVGTPGKDGLIPVQVYTSRT
jgi:hypothetical protein